MQGVMRAWYEVEAGQSAVTGTMVRALVRARVLSQARWCALWLRTKWFYVLYHVG